MLSRRLALATALAGVLAAPLVPAVFAADAPAYTLPAAGCFNLTDPTGDAQFEVLASKELDITGVALETTSTSLLGFAKVPSLSADGPGAPFDGQRFSLKFTFNGHVFSASGSSYAHGTGAVRDGLAQTGQAAHTTQLGVDTPAVDPTDPNFVTAKGFVDSGLKVTFDFTNHFVIWDLPIADIEKYGQAKFTGDLTTVGAVAQTDEYAVGSVWDSAPDAGDDGNPSGVWTVGDNTCFSAATAPVRTLLTLTKTTKTVTASLVSIAKQPLAGQRITWKVNGRNVGTEKTNASGLATLRGVHKGDHVKATFKTVKGKYVGSSASTTV